MESKQNLMKIFELNKKIQQQEKLLQYLQDNKKDEKRINECKKELDQLANNRIQAKEELITISKQFNKILFQVIFEMRYINTASWDEISSSLNYSKSYLHSINNKLKTIIVNSSS